MSELHYTNVAGNFYDKYGSKNIVVRRMMAGFLAAFDHLVETSGARVAHEIGCGEGNLTLRLARKGVAVRGCDVSEDIVEHARVHAREVGISTPFAVKSLYDLRAPHDAAELVVCCEVLEHLPDTRKALDILAELAQPFLIVSVPREPLWRFLNVCRLKYLSDFGNTPGHIQHWSSRTFLLLLQERFNVLAVSKPLPWTMALCEVRVLRECAE